MKVMSIIGVVWFTLSLLFILGSYEIDVEYSAAWGMLGMLYAIPFSIFCLVESNKRKSSNSYLNLINLNELKEKGIISDAEFNSKKNELLRNEIY
jgi:hypothetical protein